MLLEIKTRSFVAGFMTERKDVFLKGVTEHKRIYTQGMGELGVTPLMAMEVEICLQSWQRFEL